MQSYAELRHRSEGSVEGLPRARSNSSKPSSTTRFRRSFNFQLEARLSGRCSNNDQNASNSAAAPSRSSDVLSILNRLAGSFQRPPLLLP